MGKKNPKINFVKIFCVICVTLLWWNAWFSVFDLKAAAHQTGMKETVFAAVAGSGLVLLLLIGAFRVRRLRMVAYLVLLLPFIAAACARKFPPARAAWLLLLAMVLYGTCCAVEEAGAKEIIRSLVPIMAVFGIAAGLSFFAGKQIDRIREDEDGFYREARRGIRENVIGKAGDLAEKITYNKKEEQDSKEEKAEERLLDHEKDNDRASAENKKLSPIEEVLEEQDGSMEDLKAIASFKPSVETSTCVVLEKKTTYLYENWGTTYKDSAWTNEKLEEILRSSEHHSKEETYDIFLQYPAELVRMREMCDEWDKSSVSVVKEQIEEALADVVYDVNPGSTPVKWDFAEYFLFENKKGFCMHFATTAALFYRMCGYPSVYVEGSVVPASAFKEKENGIYEAQVDGTMGHAWCEVYDETSGQWITMEHTPASRNSEAGAEVTAPQNEEGTENSFFDQEKMRMLLRIVCVIFAAGAISGSVFIQARIRKKRHQKKIRTLRNGIGILTMYDDVVRIARLTEETKKYSFRKKRLDTDYYSEVRFENLKKQYSQIPSEKWNMFYEYVRRILFYHPPEEKEQWQESCRVYDLFCKEAEKRMDRRTWLHCKYIDCIGEFSRGKRAGSLGKKKGKEKEKVQ